MYDPLISVISKFELNEIIRLFTQFIGRLLIDLPFSCYNPWKMVYRFGEAMLVDT